jgi:hypothetical protein
MATRNEVYAAVDSERDYQDLFIHGNPERCTQDQHPHSVGDYLTMLATYVRKAQDAWTNNPGVLPSLHEIRKVAGIAVACMEEHGAPGRLCPSTCPVTTGPDGKAVQCAESPAHAGKHCNRSLTIIWD